MGALLRRPVRLLMLVTAGLLCVGAGVGVGRLPMLGQAGSTAAGVHGATHGAVPVQGVKIHGFWTIKVYDHNRLVQNREFENSLVTIASIGNGGDSVLAALLTRTYTMGPWQVYVNDPAGASLFQLSSAPDNQAAVQGLLTVSGSTPAHAVLTGSYTPAGAINIGKVSTSVSMCAGNQTPNACVNYYGSFFFNFTAATLASPVAVAAGQIVQVKVDISFS